MKEALFQGFVSLVLLLIVVLVSGEWLISSTGIHPQFVLVLWAVAWALIGWLCVGFAERKMQLMRVFLGKDAGEVLAIKAQKLDDLYGEEIYFYGYLREYPEDKASPKQLRWTKRAIRKAKPEFWRAVRFAVESKLIEHGPASYRDMLPKKNQAA